ncbi:MAG: DUF3891 family protein [Planctomycetaceae bacterium]
MILREANDGFLLISQVDHARLAGALAESWGNRRVAGLPLAEWLVPAIRDHDEGWRNWEASPTVTAGGRPRTFTEMPTAEATVLWSVSIDVCASGPPSSADALRKLRRDNGEVTPDDAAVLETVLRHRGSFGVDRLRTEVVSDEELTAEAFAASLTKLERFGAIVRLPVVLGGPAYAINLPTTGGSPLGGVWVSRHFCALAESAREHRADRPDEVAAADAFLVEQSAKQGGWAAAVREFAGDELKRVLDTGFRYVQFFDRISLWLCMAERDEPWEATLSSSLTLKFTPRSPREIEVSPWPFGPAALELSAPAMTIPAVSYQDDAALRKTVADAERTTLRWVLVRGDE